MCADRRVTDGEEISSMVKIAKNQWLIAAASGAATSTLAVKRAVQNGAWSAEDLIEHVDASSSALVLMPNGLILRIEEGVVWPTSKGAVQAIGSGADYARGFLAGTTRGWPERDDARRAHRAVARARTDCGGGVDFREFGHGTE